MSDPPVAVGLIAPGASGEPDADASVLSHHDGQDTSTANAAAGGVPAGSKPQKKRRRPALACEQCRRRKVRCDRNMPCNHCVKSRIPDCTYAPTHIPASWAKKNARPAGETSRSVAGTEGDSSQPFILPAAPGVGNPRAEIPQSEYIHDSAQTYHKVPTLSSSRPSSVGGSASQAPDDVDWLKARVDHLEEKLSKVVTISNDTPDHATPETQSSAPIEGTVSKTRYFGRSHWMNATTILPIQMKLLHRVELEKGELAMMLNRCKSIGRVIKEHRYKPLSTLEIGKHMPTKELADQLIDAYLRTFEGALRILHIPSFKAEYDRYWQMPEAASDFFAIQMQLCMALGAVFHDDTFSMKTQAAQWIYEAQLWLMLPPEKSRMTIAGIQIMCLLTLARTVCAVGHDLVWINTGGLVRKAMYMGLHRDPRHLADMTTYRAEMRRRLWATILELNLQSSFDAGGPPLISALDYDVQPPANLDDDQLSDQLDRERKPANPDVVTQMSVPLELSKSLPLRLNLLRHANDFRSDESYDETLRFNSELTKACRSLSQSLAIFLKSQEGKATPQVSTFHTSMAELFVYRCFHTLHQPVISRFLDDPRFYFSRKMYLDGALKITHICNLSGAGRSEGPGGTIQPEKQTDFNRLTINGAGTFRNVPIQSMPSIVIELIHSKAGGGGAEAPGLGLGYLPSVHDYDLYATLEAAVEWTRRRVRSGETNVKGHCFAASCLTHVDAVEAHGSDTAKIENAILDNAPKVLERCLEEMKGLAEREGVLHLIPPEVAGGASLGIPGDGQQLVGGDIPSMGMVPLGEDEMMADFMGDWAWDEMNGLLWGSPRPFDDHPPPVFG